MSCLSLAKSERANSCKVLLENLQMSPVSFRGDIVYFKFNKWESALRPAVRAELKWNRTSERKHFSDLQMLNLNVYMNFKI